MNNICLTGNLTKEPELRRTSTGMACTTISLAVERDFVGKDGKKDVDFIDCVVWNKLAEIVHNNYHKGYGVALTGNLRTRYYEDKNGKNQKVSEVYVEKISIVRFPKNAQQSNSKYNGVTDEQWEQAVQQSQQGTQQQTQQKPSQVDLDQFTQAMENIDLLDEDIQF